MSGALCPSLRGVHTCYPPVADGIGSRLRPKLLQDGVDYRWDSGQVAYRAFVPVELLKGHASLEWLTNPQAGGLYVWADQKQRVVSGL